LIKLIRIVAPHFVAGIEILRVPTGILGCTENKYDNNCAPIIKYMKCWSPYKIKCYCEDKKWGHYIYKENKNENTSEK